MDVSDLVLGLAARTESSDLVALRNSCTTLDDQRSEVCERRPVPVGRRDRDRQTVSRDRARERHFAGNRRANGTGSTGPVVVAERDVDASVLPGCVLVVADMEALENNAVHGPRPRPARRRTSERADRGNERSDDEARCPMQVTRGHASACDRDTATRLTVLLQRAAVEGVLGRTGESGDDLRRSSARGAEPDEGGDRVECLDVNLTSRRRRCRAHRAPV